MADLQQKRRFHADLKAMGFDSYSDYLKSTLWLSIRARAMRARGPLCQRCFKADATEVHHANYRRAVLEGKAIGKLWPVCRACHDAMHYPGATLGQANAMIPELAQQKCARSKRRKGKGRAAKLQRIKRLGCNPRAFGLG